MSNRSQMARAFTDALAQVRNGTYRVYRGPVNWVAFDFTTHPLGAAVILADTALLDSGEADIVLELFAAWHETPIERNKPLDDLTLDDLYEDVRLAVKAVTQAKRQDGEAVLAAPLLKRARVEETYVQGTIMGIIAKIPVAF